MYGFDRPLSSHFFVLKAFAHENGCVGHLRHWDIPFWSQKQKEHLFRYGKECIFASVLAWFCIFNFVFSQRNCILTDVNFVSVFPMRIWDRIFLYPGLNLCSILNVVWTTFGYFEFRKLPLCLFNFFFVLSLIFSCLFVCLFVHLLLAP